MLERTLRLLKQGLQARAVLHAGARDRPILEAVWMNSRWKTRPLDSPFASAELVLDRAVVLQIRAVPRVLEDDDLRLPRPRGAGCLASRHVSPSLGGGHDGIGAIQH